MTEVMIDKTGKIAQAIMAAHAAGEPFGNLDGDLAPEDLAQAYAAQARLHELHAEGGRGILGGRKIALASKVQQELCGVDHPIAGGIFANEIVASPAAIEMSQYHGLGVEFELAFKLDSDLTSRNGPYGKETICECIASVHPAFELIIDRKADYSNLDVLTMIADNAWSAGVVLGPEVLGWREQDLDNLTGVLHWNDDPPVEARTGDADPLGSLVWVVNLVTGMEGSLRAGEIVITGSVIKTRYPTAGDRMRYEFAGFCETVLDIV